MELGCLVPSDLNKSTARTAVSRGSVEGAYPPTPTDIIPNGLQNRPIEMLAGRIVVLKLVKDESNSPPGIGARAPGFRGTKPEQVHRPA